MTCWDAWSATARDALQHLIGFDAGFGYYCWQIDAKGSAASDFTLDSDDPVVILDDAVYHREAEARAFPRALGGEERLEDAIGDCGVHAHARVADLEPQVVAGR